MSRLTGRTRSGGGEAGAITVEFLGWLPWLLLVAALTSQVLLVAGAVTNAENAARTGARAAALDEEPEAAATASLPGWLQPHTQVRRHPDATSCAGPSTPSANRVVVCVSVPLLLPWVSVDPIGFTRTAEMPD